MTTIFTSRIVRRSLFAALLLASSGTGCGGVESEMDPDVDPGDTTAPVLVDSIPAANATGVPANQKITLTFSEPMDPATVEDAYSSSLLPLDKVSFQWSPDQKVLTISPDAPLEYAAGTGFDPSEVTPLTYAITIGAGAADLAGNPLGAALELSFATRRRMTTPFPIVPDLTKALLDTGVLAGVSLFIGDNSAGKRYHSYVTFDLTALPAGSEVEAASFDGNQTAPFGLPYALGAIMTQHIAYSTMDNISAVQAISLPGELSTNGNVERKFIDVTSQVQDDVINRATRGDRSQYRLQIDKATDGDGVADTAVFTKNSFKMMITYVVD